MDRLVLEWQDVFDRLEALKIDREGLTVYGVPKGGMILAGFLRKAKITHDPAKADFILDDIFDSGKTLAHYKKLYPSKIFVYLIDKEYEGWGGQWITFPWETDHPVGEDSIEDNVLRMIQYIGEDPTRPGLRDTPRRVVKAWDELFSGYKVDVPSLFKVFDEGADEMVILRGIRMQSMCEHHLLGFTGTATVGYLPHAGKVLGLSKITRIVNAFSRRLQLQERLTKQIAEAIWDHLKPTGVGVVIRAHHSCMGLRGVMDGGSEMITSSMLGSFREKPEVRSEFLRLIEL